MSKMRLPFALALALHIGGGAWADDYTPPPGGPVTATGATSPVSPQQRAAVWLTPYDFASANANGVINTDGQRVFCTVSTTATQNVATISGTNCGPFAVGEYLDVFDAGASLGSAPIVSASAGVAGSYTSMPTIAVTDTPTTSAFPSPLNVLASATVASIGANCTPGSQTFTLTKGGYTIQAQVTGTVGAGGTLTLNASLAVSNAGAYDILPSGPVTLSGGGCVTAPTITPVWQGEGAGAWATPNAYLETAAFVGYGSGCPASQTVTLLLAGGGGATVAQVSFTTNSSGVATGSPTIVIAGSYSFLPSASPASLAANGATTCSGSYPTISPTWGMLAPTMYATGYGYFAPALTYSSGAATATATLGAPVNVVYAGTVTAVSGNNVTVSGAGFGASISGSHWIQFGHSDLPAIQAAVNASKFSSAGAMSCAWLPPAPAGRFWGVDGPIVINGGNVPTCLRGATFSGVQVLALTPMASVITQSGSAVGGRLSDITFDGGKLAAFAGYLGCPESLVGDNVWFNNPAPYQSGLQFGANASSCNNSRLSDSGSINNAALYNDVYDEPLRGLLVQGESDSYVTRWATNNVSSDYARQTGLGYSLHLDRFHGWNYPGTKATNTLRLSSSAEVYDIEIDGSLINDILIDTTGGVNINGGHDANSTVHALNGIIVATGLPNVIVDPELINDLVAQGSAINLGYPFGARSGENGTICPNATGPADFCFGYLAGLNVSSGGANFFGGYAAGYGSSANKLTGNGNMGLGNYAGWSLQGPAKWNTMLGIYSCELTTTGQNNICIGYNTATLTPTTGNELNIGGLLFANLAATGASTAACGSTGFADPASNGKSGTITCSSDATTSGTLTFSAPYQAFVHCRVISESGLALSYSPVKVGSTYTGISFGAAVPLANTNVDYDCDGV